MLELQNNFNFRTLMAVFKERVSFEALLIERLSDPRTPNKDTLPVRKLLYIYVRKEETAIHHLARTCESVEVAMCVPSKPGNQ